MYTFGVVVLVRCSYGVGVPRRFGGFAQVLQTVQVAVLGRILTRILEYLVERKFDEYEEDACANAAMNGHLDCLKYLHETAKAPWDEEAVREAHDNEHTECVQYLLDNNCPLPTNWRYDDGTLYDEFYQPV